MSTHERLSPSSTPRWISCPGSASEDAPVIPPGPSAILGTELHELAAVRVSTGECHGSDPPIIKKYVEYCYEHRGDNILIEEKLVSPDISDFGGTVDFATLWDFGFARIVDLKTGKRPVPAKNNLQLLSYAILVDSHFGPFPHIDATIIQGDGPPKETKFSADQLENHVQRVRAASKSSELRSGEHCLFCPFLIGGKCDVGEAYAEQHGWRDKFRHLAK